MNASRLQLGIGLALIAIFAAVMVTTNANVPERAAMTEASLGNIVRANEGEQFEAGFGELQYLVPDNGGEEPVAFDDATPQRLAQFRSEAWLLEQPPSHYTIQLGVFSSERAAADFIRSNGNSADLRYFAIPQMPDPALGYVTSAQSRFIVSFAEFFTSEHAAGVAGILTGYGDQYLVRPWQSYQLSITSVKAVLARNFIAKQEAQARMTASDKLRDQAFQGVDPVELLAEPLDE